MSTRQSPRQRLLARVHIARKEMRLGECDYRAVLVRMAGECSAGDCTDDQLVALLDEFRRLGWKPKSGRKISDNAQVRMIYAIWGDVRRLLAARKDGAPAGDGELRSFVQRQTRDDLHPNGRDAPEFLDAEQANRVIEGLKAWRANLRGRAGNGGPSPTLREETTDAV